MKYLAYATLALFIIFALRAGCIYHMPMIIENDTSRPVFIDIKMRAYPQPIHLRKTDPDRHFGSRHCWKENDAILLATEKHPDPIALDPKDFCSGLCQCDPPVSKLLKQMTPSFVLKRQQDVCAGGGPFLLPDVRLQLCRAYVARSTGNSLSSGPDPAMLVE